MNKMKLCLIALMILTVCAGCGKKEEVETAAETTTTPAMQEESSAPAEESAESTSEATAEAVAESSQEPKAEEKDKTSEKTTESPSETEQEESVAPSTNRSVYNFKMKVPDGWEEKDANGLKYFYADSANFIVVNHSATSPEFTSPITEKVFDDMLGGMTSGGNMTTMGEIYKSEFKTNGGVNGRQANMMCDANGVVCSVNVFSFTHEGHLNTIAFYGSVDMLTTYLPIYRDVVQSVSVN